MIDESIVLLNGRSPGLHTQELFLGICDIVRFLLRDYVEYRVRVGGIEVLLESMTVKEVLDVSRKDRVRRDHLSPKVTGLFVFIIKRSVR